MLRIPEGVSNCTPHGVTPHHTIDLARDHLIALARLNLWCEERTGRRIDRTVPYRWSRRGIDGLKLPTILVGGRRFTSQEAFAWWCWALAKSRHSEGLESGRHSRRDPAIFATGKVTREVRP